MTSAFQLRVRVLEARGIRAADFGGTSDPFVEVRIKNSTQVFKTRGVYPFLLLCCVFSPSLSLSVILSQSLSWNAHLALYPRFVIQPSRRR
jgi:hypothetical protein